MADNDPLRSATALRVPINTSEFDSDDRETERRIRRGVFPEAPEEAEDGELSSPPQKITWKAVLEAITPRKLLFNGNWDHLNQTVSNAYTYVVRGTRKDLLTLLRSARVAGPDRELTLSDVTKLDASTTQIVTDLTTTISLLGWLHFASLHTILNIVTEFIRGSQLMGETILPGGNDLWHPFLSALVMAGVNVQQPSTLVGEHMDNIAQFKPEKVMSKLSYVLSFSPYPKLSGDDGFDKDVKGPVPQEIWKLLEETAQLLHKLAVTPEADALQRALHNNIFTEWSDRTSPSTHTFLDAAMLFETFQYIHAQYNLFQESEASKRPVLFETLAPFLQQSDKQSKRPAQIEEDMRRILNPRIQALMKRNLYTSLQMSLLDTSMTQAALFWLASMNNPMDFYERVIHVLIEKCNEARKKGDPLVEAPGMDSLVAAAMSLTIHGEFQHRRITSANYSRDFVLENARTLAIKNPTDIVDSQSKDVSTETLYKANKTVFERIGQTPERTSELLAKWISSDSSVTDETIRTWIDNNMGDMEHIYAYIREAAAGDAEVMRHLVGDNLDYVSALSHGYIAPNDPVIGIRIPADVSMRPAERVLGSGANVGRFDALRDALTIATRELIEETIKTASTELDIKFASFGDWVLTPLGLADGIGGPLDEFRQNYKSGKSLALDANQITAFSAAFMDTNGWICDTYAAQTHIHLTDGGQRVVPLTEDEMAGHMFVFATVLQIIARHSAQMAVEVDDQVSIDAVGAKQRARGDSAPGVQFVDLLQEQAARYEKNAGNVYGIQMHTAIKALRSMRRLRTECHLRWARRSPIMRSKHLLMFPQGAYLVRFLTSALFGGSDMIMGFMMQPHAALRDKALGTPRPTVSYTNGTTVGDVTNAANSPLLYQMGPQQFNMSRIEDYPFPSPAPNATLSQHLYQYPSASLHNDMTRIIEQPDYVPWLTDEFCIAAGFESRAAVAQNPIGALITSNTESLRIADALWQGGVVAIGGNVSPSVTAYPILPLDTAPITRATIATNLNHFTTMNEPMFEARGTTGVFIDLMQNQMTQLSYARAALAGIQPNITRMWTNEHASATVNNWIRGAWINDRLRGTNSSSEALAMYLPNSNRDFNVNSLSVLLTGEDPTPNLNQAINNSVSDFLSNVPTFSTIKRTASGFVLRAAASSAYSFGMSWLISSVIPVAGQFSATAFTSLTTAWYDTLRSDDVTWYNRFWKSSTLKNDRDFYTPEDTTPVSELFDVMLPDATTSAQSLLTNFAIAASYHYLVPRAATWIIGKIGALAPEGAVRFFQFLAQHAPEGAYELIILFVVSLILTVTFGYGISMTVGAVANRQGWNDEPKRSINPRVTL